MKSSFNVLNWIVLALFIIFIGMGCSSSDTPPPPAPGNNPPAASETPSEVQDAKVGDQIELDGSIFTDPDGDPLTYQWEIQEKPDQSAGNLTDTDKVKAKLFIDKSGRYKIKLTVSDGEDTASEIFTIEIINQAPVANAGSDMRVSVGETVTLNGGNSSDPDGDPITFQWLLVKPGGSSAALSDPSAQEPTFFVDVRGVYQAVLTVSDGELKSSNHIIQIRTCTDEDNDGFFSESLCGTARDCDDGDPAINPGTVEICDDNIDNDCDGNVDEDSCETPVERTWYRDADDDGHSDGATLLSFSRPTGYKLETELASMEIDCNDGNGNINPGANEIPDNGIDEDCSGADLKTWYRDSDGDNFGNPGNTTLSETQPANYVADSSDCDDTDADEHPGQTWYVDADNDGYASATPVTNCEREAGYKLSTELISMEVDCNDSDAAEHPGQTWYLDADNDGYKTGNSITNCVRETGYKLAAELVSMEDDCNDGDDSINPGATEIPGNGIDEDCSGDDLQTWYRDSDSDTYGDINNSTTSDIQPAGYVADSSDCDDSNGAVHPGAAEDPNDGIDNDCDGIVDFAANLSGTWNLTWDENLPTEESVTDLVLIQTDATGTVYNQCGGTPIWTYVITNDQIVFSTFGDACGSMTFTIDDPDTLTGDNGEGGVNRFTKVSDQTDFSYTPNSSLAIQSDELLCGNAVNADSSNVCVETEGPEGAFTRVKIRTQDQNETVGIIIDNLNSLQANTTYDIVTDGIDFRVTGTYIFDCACDDFLQAESGHLTVNTYDGTTFSGEFNVVLTGGFAVSGSFDVNFSGSFAGWNPLNMTDYIDAEGKKLIPGAFYNGRLYATAAVSQEDGNPGTLIQVWAYDGIHWHQVNSDGFGDLNNLYIDEAAMAVFNNRLYVSATNEVTGLEIWEYDGANWLQVNQDGFGNSAGNRSSLAMTVFDDKLFVGVDNEFGEGIDVLYYDGNSWTDTDLDDAGNNELIVDMIEYNNHLYISTYRDSAGCEIWAYDGSSWQNVQAAGFGDASNKNAISMVEYNNHLIVGTTNEATGGEVWRYDGQDWMQINADGFGNPNNIAAFCIGVFDDELYASTGSLSALGEIWKYDGNSWQSIIVSGLNHVFSYGGKFGDSLFIGDYSGYDSTVWQLGTTNFLRSWYKDADGDGYSDGTIILSETRPAEEYFLQEELISISGDFDDGNPNINPGVTTPVIGTWNTTPDAQSLDGVTVFFDQNCDGSTVGDEMNAIDNTTQSSASNPYYWNLQGLAIDTIELGNFVDNGDGTGTRSFSSTRSGGLFTMYADHLWGQAGGTTYTASVQADSNGTSYYIWNESEQNWNWDHFIGEFHAWGVFNEDPSYKIDFTADYSAYDWDQSQPECTINGQFKNVNIDIFPTPPNERFMGKFKVLVQSECYADLVKRTFGDDETQQNTDGYIYIHPTAQHYDYIFTHPTHGDLTVDVTIDGNLMTIVLSNGTTYYRETVFTWSEDMQSANITAYWDIDGFWCNGTYIGEAARITEQPSDITIPWAFIQYRTYADPDRSDRIIGYVEPLISGLPVLPEELGVDYGIDDPNFTLYGYDNRTALFGSTDTDGVFNWDPLAEYLNGFWGIWNDPALFTPGDFTMSAAGFTQNLTVPEESWLDPISNVSAEIVDGNLEIFWDEPDDLIIHDPSTGYEDNYRIDLNVWKSNSSEPLSGFWDPAFHIYVPLGQNSLSVPQQALNQMFQMTTRYQSKGLSVSVISRRCYNDPDIGDIPQNNFARGYSKFVEVTSRNDTFNKVSFPLTVRAEIDGLSQLMIKGNTIWWHHINWEPPGLWGDENATALNGEEWYPEWPEGDLTDCNCDSSIFEALESPLPEDSTIISVNVVSGRGSVTVAQQPNQDNDYTAIIEFDDYIPAADWYEIIIDHN